MKKSNKSARVLWIIVCLSGLPWFLNSQIILPTPIPAIPVFTEAPGIIAITPTPINIILTPTPTPFVYLTPSPEPPKPDLAIKGAFCFSSDNLLAFMLKNEGTAEAPQGIGTIKIFSENRLMQIISLADIPDQQFRYPGEFVSVLTSIRMNADAGEQRKIAVSIDPEDEIDELNEYQNSYSRTICPPPALSGPDFIISSATLSGDSMIVTIKNRGPQVSIPGINARIRLNADGNPVMTQPIILPSILPRNMSAVSIPLTQSSGFHHYSRITVTIETINILDEIDNTNNSFDYGEVLPAKILLYHNLLSVSKIANSIVWIEYNAIRRYDG